MSSFEPELGQYCFSNSPWGEVEMQPHVSTGIDFLGDFISKGEYGDDPTVNSGCEEFDNGTFAMRPYCWCDGDRHREGCPPNFVCDDFEARWYKHSQRGASQNRVLSRDEWHAIFRHCLDSLDTA